MGGSHWGILRLQGRRLRPRAEEFIASLANPAEACHFREIVARRSDSWHNGGAMKEPLPSTKVPVGPQGRLVIPSDIRRQLGISPGDVLIALVEDERLVLEKRDVVLQRLRRRFAHVPAGVSLADELISERRQESRR